MVNIITVLSTLALVGGGIGYLTLPMIMEYSLKAMLNLKESGVVYPMYMRPPFPTRSSYRIFSVTNPKEVLTGAKMKLKLKGPYYYDTQIWRDNITFMKGGEIVKYDSHRTLVLDEASSENLDEQVWLLNPIFAGMQATVKSMVIDKVPFKRLAEPIVFNSVNVLLDYFKERLFIKRSPRELMEGKKIELLEAVTSLADRVGLRSLIPPGPPENTFGIAHAQNHTIETMAVYTGTGQTKHRFAEVYSYKDFTSVPVWKGKCAEISGTNGELYKPLLKAGKPIQIFLGQLCRTFTVDPISDKLTEVKLNVKAFEYKLTDKLFQGSKTNPNNKCFCIDPNAYDCKLDGLMNMGPCFFNAPLFFARPNFLGVDRKIRSLLDESTIEYENIPTKQSFYLEPITGTVVRADFSLLGVFKVNRQPYMRDMANLQNVTYAPLFIASEYIDLPNLMLYPLKLLQLFYFNHKIIFGIMIASGGAVLAYRLLLSRRSESSKVSAEPSTDRESIDSE